MAFTDFSLDEIDGVMAFNDINLVKAKLADRVCADIFGEELSETAELVSKSMFGKSLMTGQTYEQLKTYAKLLPAVECR